jgi:hypothetical protein
VCAPDRRDLAGVVVSVGEVEAAPLRGGERTEGEVGEAACGAEGVVGLTEDDIEMGEGIAGDRSELFA